MNQYQNFGVVNNLFPTNEEFITDIRFELDRQVELVKSYKDGYGERPRVIIKISVAEAKELCLKGFNII